MNNPQELVTLPLYPNNLWIEQKEIEPIILNEYQEPHFNELINISSKHPVMLNYSRTGGGKTYLTAAFSAINKFPIILISPPTIFKVWKDMQEKHGLQIVDMISYDILRGISGRGCNHPYLIREGEEFYPTDYLRNWILQGVLFVFDEMAALKNITTIARKAAHTIIKEIVKMKSSSRGMLLSALPCDKEEQLVSLLQMLGVIMSDKLCEYDSQEGKYIFLGLQELINWCHYYDKGTTLHILSKHPVSDRKSIIDLMADLYRNIVSYRLSSCVKLPRDEIDIKSGYYFLPKDDLEILARGEKILKNATRIRDINNEIVTTKVDWSKITRGLQLLGIAKLRTIVRLVFNDLVSNPNCKVIVGAWYKAHINWLTATFAEFGARSLYGETKRHKRNEIIDLFQEDNNRCRVIIMNPTVGGVGINLDDRRGNRPRYMYLVPDYRIMPLIQCTGRIVRLSTVHKHLVKIRFVYALEFSGEIRILSSLIQKSEEARTVIFNDSGIILPDMYGMEEEKVMPTYWPCSDVDMTVMEQEHVEIKSDEMMWLTL